MLQSGRECCHVQPLDGTLPGYRLIAWMRSLIDRFEAALHAQYYRKAQRHIRELAKYDRRVIRDVFLDDPPRASGAKLNS